jgi:hypothetical protein
MLSDIDFALMLTILALNSATFCYIGPKTRQKSSMGIAKNPAKTPQKSAKNPLKICDKNFLRK